MNFKVGDIIKTPKGKCLYKVLSVELKYNRHTFGDIYILNLDTGKQYDCFSNRFVIWEPVKPIKDKKLVKFKF